MDNSKIVEKRVPREIVLEMNSLFAEIQQRLLMASGEDEAQLILNRLRDIAEGKAQRITLPPPAKNFKSDYFVPTTEQIVNVLKWNQEFGWGLDDMLFELPDPPDWPDGELSAVVLAVYFENAEKTYEQLWQAIYRTMTTQKPMVVPFRNSNKGALSLVSGQTHPGTLLRWEVLDFGRGSFPADSRPADVRNDSSPHAAVLSAAAHFPKWLLAMNGKDIPFVWIHGYKMLLGDDQPWPRRVPFLGWDSQHVDLSLELLSEVRSNPMATFPRYLI